MHLSLSVSKSKLPLYLSYFGDGVSLALIQAFLPLYVYADLGETRLRVVALLLALPALGTFVASHLWGAVADRTGRLRPWLLVGLAGHILVLASLMVLHSAASVLAVAVVSSLLFAAIGPTLKTWVTLGSTQSVGQALSDVLRFQSWGWFAGSLGTGFLLDRAGLSLPVVALLAMLPALAALAASLAWLPDVRKPTSSAAHPPRVGGEKAPAPLLETLEDLYRARHLWPLFLTILAAVLANESFFAVLGVYFTQVVAGSRELMGFSLALATLLGALLYPLAGRFVDRHGPEKVLTAAAATYLAVYLAIALVRNPYVVAVAFGVPLYPVLITAAASVMTQRSLLAQRGGGLGIVDGLFALGLAGGSLLGGVLGDALGLSAVPWASSMLAALAVGGSLWVRLAAASSAAVPPAPGAATGDCGAEHSRFTGSAAAAEIRPLAGIAGSEAKESPVER